MATIHLIGGCLNDMPLLIPGRIGVETNPFLKEPTQPLQDPPVETAIVFLVKDLVQAWNAQRETDRPICVSSQILYKPVKLALVGDQHGTPKGSQHVDTVQKIL